jgi:hypothetical protein
MIFGYVVTYYTRQSKNWSVKDKASQHNGKGIQNYCHENTKDVR